MVLFGKRTILDYEMRQNCGGARRILRLLASYPAVGQIGQQPRG